ncbi:IclR family transcriptional regulator [Patulibacter sp.]|uniref:IclR family transcriptional regulator n=1 Tax=Patulibacter sp. TaxID=1912859 RepID=UPI00271D77B3|nr:IclR family transcriptional regulator [Patulibacter sp.]MDO9409020.1 IclR family transcriptional regulator [Patulibacter sp.]
MTETSTKTSGAQSVHRAIAILETFSAETPARALVEIAERVGITVPTAHRLLRALQERGLIVLDDATRKYGLGPGIMRLADVVLDQGHVIRTSQATLQRLRETTGETVGLHWRTGDRRVCLLELVSTHPVRMASGVGNTYPLVHGAAGKVILAGLDEDEVSRLIAQDEAPSTERSRKRLRDDLSRIAGLGYADSESETVEGASAVAAVIRGADGRPLGALNVTGPADRFDDAARSAAATAAVTRADEISALLLAPPT